MWSFINGNIFRGNNLQTNLKNQEVIKMNFIQNFTLERICDLHKKSQDFESFNSDIKQNMLKNLPLTKYFRNKDINLLKQNVLLHIQKKCENIS